MIALRVDTASPFFLISWRPNNLGSNNMKALVLSIFTVLTLAFAGCTKPEGGASIDTSAIERSFASAETALKDTAMKAVDAVKKADYKGALKELQGLASNVKLTDDQKNAINKSIEQVKKAITDMGAKAAEGASKVMGGAQKTLGK